MRTFHFLPLTLALIVVGCDKLEQPDNYVPVPDCEGNGYGFRRVLIEDMTGFRCIACPQAAEIARDLQDFYCEDVIVTSLHVTSTFAEPINAPPGPFSTDFRTPAGDAFEAQFPPGSLPIGMINRKIFNGTQPMVQRGDWAASVASMIGAPAQFEVTIDTIILNSVSQAYDFTIKIPVLQNVTGDHKLAIYLTEDSVVDWQKDSRFTPSDIFPYYHRHVLRTTLGDPFGEQVISGSESAGQTISRNFSLILPANVVSAEHCSVVAYIYRSDNYEIMQVSERHLNE
ncbi:MAG: Omp28-related outer membrane protein [Flavobacteriales bacterium]|nr:Omp28-related outer membrane protein [Flavobacteriales bacterium]